MAQETHSMSNQELAQERTDWAHERTQMASTRTFFAMLRTGLAIAGGGSAVTAILAYDWPDWVVGLLASVFILVGYTIMLDGLQRYRKMAERLAVEGEVEAIPTRLIVALTVVLQVATVIVLVLFLLR
jgi:putative membrane protein